MAVYHRYAVCQIKYDRLGQIEVTGREITGLSLEAARQIARVLEEVECEDTWVLYWPDSGPVDVIDPPVRVQRAAMREPVSIYRAGD